MKKFIIKSLICVLSLCAVLGIVSVAPVMAGVSDVAGFELNGAGIRKSLDGEDDLSGLRFTTVLTKSAYQEILSKNSNEKVYFGTEVTTTVENAEVQDFCYVSSAPSTGEVAPHFESDSGDAEFEYYASITFNREVFRRALADKLGVELTDARLDTAVEKYIKQAYGTELKATSYYKVNGVKYYTDSVVRSISMVANYYAKTPEYYEDYLTVASKNYFEEGDKKNGYIMGDGTITVYDLDIESVQSLAYNAKPLIFTNSGNLKIDTQELEIPQEGETIKLYAFAESNVVTTLELESVNELPIEIKIGGNDISNYKIAVDSNDSTANEIGAKIQSAISAKTSQTLEIVGLDYDGLAIIVKQVAKSETAEEGYREYVDGNGNLVIECSYSNKFEDTANVLVESFADVNSSVILSGNYDKVVDVSKVYYSDFGVVGDGVTNDFLAMKSAHDFANISGQTVMGEEGKTYYIGTSVNASGDAESIDVKTNVDWQNANIIIDDTNITDESLERTLPVFNIVSSYDDWYVGVGSENATKYIPNKTIVKGETNKLENPRGVKLLLRIYDSTKQAGGRNGSAGGSLNEICLIDENGNVLDGDGNISSDTFLYNFTNVTSIVTHRADDEPITVKNATIQTLATQYSIPLTDGKGTDVGINRGITVARSNVVLDGIKHSVDNEQAKNVDTTDDTPDYCSMSAKFLVVSDSANVTVQNCQFDGRTYYLQGTYDISVHESFNVLFENCTQEDFDIADDDTVTFDKTKWGVMGSHGIKYVTYDNCVLSRYDAHTRAFGGKILNSKVATVSVVGGGDLLIENCVIYARSSTPEDGLRYIITLRADYGASWNGTITLKDTRVLTSSGQIGKIFESNFKNYKYNDESIRAQFPNVVIDNLMIAEGKYKENIWIGLPHLALTEPNILTYGAMTLDYQTNNYVYSPAEFITVKNNSANGYNILVPSDNDYFTNTTLSGATFNRYYETTSDYKPIRQEDYNIEPGWLDVDLG